MVGMSKVLTGTQQNPYLCQVCDLVVCALFIGLIFVKKCVIFHLVLAGGKDNLIKLWDAKTGKELCSL